ncbi:ABC transporter ATP-binding protein/permease [Alphaproteobacteria bacterium]|nr:ABC transporter ATP-binding protein/permease [Alphaproteobacteria bacterium]
MLKVIKHFFTLLTPDQHKRFYMLQILVVLMAFAEIVGVASIIPFMALVGDMSQLQQNTIITKVYQASGITSELQFVFVLGVGVLVTLFISAMISVLTIWRLSIFANKVGIEISDRLYTHYLKQDWLYHATRNSAQLIKKIAVETDRVTGGIVIPLIQMNSSIVLALFLGLSIFIYDPIVATIGIATFAIAYFILFKLVKVRLQFNGRSISDMNEERFHLMNESFGGIKDVLLSGRENYFIKSFIQTGRIISYSAGTNRVLAQVPRYFMELMAFGSMISLLLYLIVSYDGNLGVILPIVSVYALATFKLIPAFQQIYSNLSEIKSNIAAFESIHQDLIDSKNIQLVTLKPKKSYLRPKKQISLQNVTFTYPTLDKSTIKQINLLIPTNSVIGIVGPSGSGKSTLINIILGLIKPEQGYLKIDNTIINDKNCRSWQNTIGFVAQSIFLLDGTIAENIAFGVPQNQIDLEQVQRTLKLAHLTELIQNLEHGIHTKVGERGVQISGGQCQRIGIARALYHEPAVLVFDEATSSLDGITEKMIMDAIHDFGGQKTIIMIAHRLKTVKKCDQIFFIDKGQVVDHGTYQKLIETNEHFKKMATHA